jgi:hypothetical protein
MLDVRSFGLNESGASRTWLLHARLAAIFELFHPNYTALFKRVQMHAVAS